MIFLNKNIILVGRKKSFTIFTNLQGIISYHGILTRLIHMRLPVLFGFFQVFAAGPLFDFFLHLSWRILLRENILRKWNNAARSWHHSNADLNKQMCKSLNCQMTLFDNDSMQKIRGTDLCCENYTLGCRCMTPYNVRYWWMHPCKDYIKISEIDAHWCAITARWK